MMFLYLLAIPLPILQHPFSNLSNLCEILIMDKKHFLIWHQIFATVYQSPWKQLRALTPTNTRWKSIFLTEWKIMKVIYIAISNYYFVFPITIIIIINFVVIVTIIIYYYYCYYYYYYYCRCYCSLLLSL